MPGAPGLEEIQRLRGACTWPSNTIAQPKRRTHEISRGGTILGASATRLARHIVARAILDQHNSVAGLRDFGEKGVDQSRLAGRRATRNQDVLALPDGGAQQVSLQAGHDPGLDVVTEGKHRHRRPADGKTG
jgi:hypothetical protein